MPAKDTERKFEGLMVINISVAIALSCVAESAAAWVAVIVAVCSLVNAATCAVDKAFIASADKYGTWVEVSAGIWLLAVKVLI